MIQICKSYLLHITEDLGEDMDKWAKQEFRNVNGRTEMILTRAADVRKKPRKQDDQEE